MADLTINADDVRSALNAFAESYTPDSAERVEVGHVVTAADGIAHVEGLPSVMANELVRFEDGTLGLAQNLDRREIGVIVLGDF
jgi:F-type H+-transporting ATPase subunit alpha